MKIVLEQIPNYHANDINVLGTWMTKDMLCYDDFISFRIEPMAQERFETLKIKRWQSVGRDGVWLVFCLYSEEDVAAFTLWSYSGVEI